MGELTLKFDKSNTEEKKKSHKIKYSLNGEDADGKVVAKLTLESSDPAALDKVVNKVLDGDVLMTLENLKPQ